MSDKSGADNSMTRPSLEQFTLLTCMRAITRPTLEQQPKCSREDFNTTTVQDMLDAEIERWAKKMQESSHDIEVRVHDCISCDDHELQEFRRAVDLSRIPSIAQTVHLHKRRMRRKVFPTQGCGEGFMKRLQNEPWRIPGRRRRQPRPYDPQEASTCPKTQSRELIAPSQRTAQLHDKPWCHSGKVSPKRYESAYLGASARAASWFWPSRELRSPSRSKSKKPFVSPYGAHCDKNEMVHDHLHVMRHPKTGETDKGRKIKLDRSYTPFMSWVHGESELESADSSQLSISVNKSQKKEYAFPTRGGPERMPTPALSSTKLRPSSLDTTCGENDFDHYRRPKEGNCQISDHPTDERNAADQMTQSQHVRHISYHATDKSNAADQMTQIQHVGPWTHLDDAVLLRAVQTVGKKWGAIMERHFAGRFSGPDCRQRWLWLQKPRKETQESNASRAFAPPALEKALPLPRVRIKPVRAAYLRELYEDAHSLKILPLLNNRELMRDDSGLKIAAREFEIFLLRQMGFPLFDECGLKNIHQMLFHARHHFEESGRQEFEVEVAATREVILTCASLWAEHLLQTSPGERSQGLRPYIDEEDDMLSPQFRTFQKEESVAAVEKIEKWIAEGLALFRAYDEENDGSLSIDELKDAFLLACAAEGDKPNEEKLFPDRNFRKFLARIGHPGKAIRKTLHVHEFLRQDDLFRKMHETISSGSFL